MINDARIYTLAEETGLIVPIGEWVLREACKQNKLWQDCGYKSIRIAVNLSLVQCRGIYKIYNQIIWSEEVSMEDNFYTKGEEIANAITHGVGAVLSITALVLLVIFSVMKGTIWHVVSFSIFGTTLVILYLESTLYHSITNKRAKRLFRKFDHMSIFLLISGTYTPFCVTALWGRTGWIILAIVWSSTIIGITLKGFFIGKFDALSTILYIVIGWMIVIAIKKLYISMTFIGFLCLVIGGVLYTIGTFFYARDKMKFNHGIWHLFVIGGSVCHFFSVMSLLYIK